MPEKDVNFTPDVFHGTYLNMELVIPKDGDEPEFSIVMKHLRDKDGLPISTRIMTIIFGGVPYAKKRRTSDLILRFGRKTYQRFRQYIKILHVI